MFFLLVLLALFAVGTLLLSKTSAERNFLLFMIRTKHFLRFIDSIAKITPRFWKFIADFAIIISFSGLGAAYLSKYRGESKNLDVILLFFGILAIFMWAESLPLLILMLAVLLIGISSLYRIKNPGMDFIVATSLISSILLTVLPWHLAFFEGVFGLLAILFGSFIENAFAITSGQSNMPGVSPIIPWIEEGQWGFVVPGIGIFIPLIYGLISLIILLVVHELSHGVLARAHKLKLKSTGLLTVGPIPIGAFVEPDEEKFKESESIVKMRVLSMGSFSNLVLSVIAITLFIFLILPSEGWVVADSNITSIRNGTMVKAIDNISLSPAEDYIHKTFNAKLFSNKISRINGSLLFENKSAINITTSDGVYQIKPDELSGLGMRYETDYRFNYELLGFNITAASVTALFWIFFFNINVGLANLLPLVPLDGGKMIVELMSMFRLGEESVKKIVYAFLLIGLLIILINAYPLVDMLFEWFFQIIT